MSHDIYRDLSADGKSVDAELLRALIDKLPDHVYVKDLESRYLFNNAGHFKALGAASAEEVVGKSDFDFYPKELAERYRADEQEVMRSGRPLIDIEEPSVDEEGNRRWHSTTKVPLRHVSGDVVGLMGMTRDVTKRREAEEKLKESEKRYRAVVEQTVDAIFLVDPDTKRILDSNAKFKELLGYAPEELQGMTMYDLVPHDRESVDHNAHHIVTKRRHHIGERAYRRKDGSLVDLEVSANLIEYGGRKVICSVARDITERKRAEEALKESEERYRAVLEQSVEAIYLYDAQSKRVLEANYAFQRMMGYGKDELLDVQIYDFIDHDKADIDANVRRSLKKGRRHIGERRYRRKDGSVIVVDTSASVISYDGKTALCAVSRDVTERKRFEEALAESERRFRSLIQNASDLITLLEADSTIRYDSPAIERLLGYRPDERIGKSAFDYVHPEDVERMKRTFVETVDGRGVHQPVEFRLRHKDGSWRHVEVTRSNLLDDPAVRRVVVNSRDVTERKVLEEQLRHQAFHDSLTELPNRALFLDRLEHALARARREGASVAVLFVDLDDFKVINDSLGHDAGNAVLVEVARRLRSCVRPGDTVARIFGDEFAVLLEVPARMEEAQLVTKRLSERLQAPFSVDGCEAFVAASIGITLSEASESEDQPKDLLRHADLAMYEAKSRGKARYEVFRPSMSTRVAERLDLENDLRRAVKREEFEAYYQPVIDLRTGEVSGFEALAHWRHPERGLLAAAEFIGLAEETGLIRSIGRTVFEEACRQAKEWRTHHPDMALPMSVNLSASQFSRQPDLVSEILNGTGLEPSALQLEITERVVMDDAEFSIGKLRKLKSLGVSFAIDDYGMGYSCLYYLKRMPVTFLKIDRAFIAGLGEDLSDEAIVAGTIGLAHALGLKVVAEGVETEVQVAKLKELGCDLAQGYHFAEPLPSAAAEQLLVDSTSLPEVR